MINFQLGGEINEKTADTDENEDIYGIAERVGNIGAVIKRIDTLGTESGASKCTIIEADYGEQTLNLGQSTLH